MRFPIGLGVLVPAIILFVSLTYVFFTLLLFVKNQLSRIVSSIQPLQTGAPWIQVVSAATYILSCLLMITRLEDVILYDGIFIAIYVVSVLGNLVSLWLISRGKHT